LDSVAYVHISSTTYPPKNYFLFTFAEHSSSEIVFILRKVKNEIVYSNLYQNYCYFSNWKHFESRAIKSYWELLDLEFIQSRMQRRHTDSWNLKFFKNRWFLSSSRNILERAWQAQTVEKNTEKGQEYKKNNKKTIILIVVQKKFKKFNKKFWKIKRFI